MWAVAPGMRARFDVKPKRFVGCDLPSYLHACSGRKPVCCTHARSVEMFARKLLLFICCLGGMVSSLVDSTPRSPTHDLGKGCHI
jgi:hypothetical protein